MSAAAAGALSEPRDGTLGSPRVHLRRTDSTNERARALAITGAPHGTLVTADEQTAGRGRQGRNWTALPDSALLCSLVLRGSPAPLSLIAGVAVCDVVGKRALLKWPNDVVVERARDDKRERDRHGAGRSLAKLAGILVEGRPQEGWAVLGIGLNVAVVLDRLPAELSERAASLELPTSAIEPTLGRLLEALTRRLAEPVGVTLEAWRAHDALYGRAVSWATHSQQDAVEQGVANGIDEAGRLIVRLADGATTMLDAGEVHLSGG